jgi:hypothetical protein
VLNGHILVITCDRLGVEAAGWQGPTIVGQFIANIDAVRWLLL